MGKEIKTNLWEWSTIPASGTVICTVQLICIAHEH